MLKAAPRKRLAQAAAPPWSQRRPLPKPAPVGEDDLTLHCAIDQWVALVALYPDALLSQVLMASTYPANGSGRPVVADNPTLQGDAVQARWPRQLGPQRQIAGRLSS